ncbi:MAG: ACP S-malonyltransferase [Pseudomonadota bacterium]
MSTAFFFPGQGSQSVGMMDDLAANHPQAQETFAEASDALGVDLWNLVQNGPESRLNQTAWTQPAMLAADVATYRIWRDKGGAEPDVMAGHSLGEYAALVCAEAVGFEDAIRLVARRGHLMQSAVAEGEGAMVASIGLDDDTVRSLCAEVAQGQIVAPVNFNAPGQVVVAGDASAVSRFETAARDAGAKRVLPLPVSVPSHCALMRPAADAFTSDLAEVNFRTPKVDIRHNAGALRRRGADGLRELLARQLYSPVPWRATVEALVVENIERFYECGPGRVLTGLVKRIYRRAKIHSLHDAASIDAALLDAAQLNQVLDPA